MKYASWPVIIALSFVLASEVLAQSLWYVAPKKGGPSLRVDVYHRGLCANVPRLPTDFKLDVIAPERVAHTIHAQPTLYWRVNRKVTGTFALVIEEMGSGFLFSEPLVEEFFELSAEADELQKISLDQLDVDLEQNVDYRWTLALVCDNNMRSTDIGQTGGIRYVEPKGLTDADLTKLAQNGIWYDVFHRATKSQRQKLLKQVGL